MNNNLKRKCITYSYRIQIITYYKYIDIKHTKEPVVFKQQVLCWPHTWYRKTVLIFLKDSRSPHAFSKLFSNSPIYLSLMWQSVNLSNKGGNLGKYNLTISFHDLVFWEWEQSQKLVFNVTSETLLKPDK